MEGRHIHDSLRLHFRPNRHHLGPEIGVYPLFDLFGVGIPVRADVGPPESRCFIKRDLVSLCCFFVCVPRFIPVVLCETASYNFPDASLHKLTDGDDHLRIFIVLLVPVLARLENGASLSLKIVIYLAHPVDLLVHGVHVFQIGLVAVPTHSPGKNRERDLTRFLVEDRELVDEHLPLDIVLALIILQQIQLHDDAADVLCGVGTLLQQHQQLQHRQQLPQDHFATITPQADAVVEHLFGVNGNICVTKIVAWSSRQY